MKLSDFLTEDQCARMSSGYCPDCGHRGFVLGPRGGSSTNVECGSVECRNRFNIGQGPLGHQIIMAHRLPKQSEGGSTFWGTPDASADNR